MRTRLKFLAGFVLAIVVGVAPAFANGAPTISKVYSYGILSTTGLLYVGYNDRGLPARVQFHISKNANMSNATKVYDADTQRGEGDYNATARLLNLTPATTYYYQATVSTYAGKTLSSILSFTTQAAAPAKPPTIKWLGGTQERGGYRVDFDLDLFELPGDFYVLYSTDPNLANAKRFGENHIYSLPHPIAQRPVFNTASVPDKTRIYFQGVIVTSAGTAKSAIMSFEARNAPY